MKKLFVIFLIVFGVTFNSYAQVAIGNSSPDTSAVLELSSNNKGFLPPRMSFAQRNQIASPKAGLILWCTDCDTSGQLQVYNGTRWTTLTGGVASTGIQVQLPANNTLYIIGDATEFGWVNEVNMTPAQTLTKLNNFTWGGIYNLTGSGGYLLIPTAGDWMDKYNISDAAANTPNSGTFGFNLIQNFSGNVNQGAGWHKMIFNFQTGNYTLTRETNALPTELYVTGGGTASGWVNNPPADQKFTMISSGVFEINIPLTGSNLIKLVSNPGSWQPQFGGASSTGGALQANYGTGVDPSPIPTPANSGVYKILVNFITREYSITPL
jgi:hypothetical protein